MRRLGVRWTIGDVSPAGFEALRLSIWGAVGVFGPEARYAVCVNTLSLADARRRTGEVPARVEWVAAPREPPRLLRPFLDEGMAEGVAWKLAPLRLFPQLYELALDNDVILWRRPVAIDRWLEGDGLERVLAADVVPAHGRFAHLCGPEPRNSGIRGVPPDLDFEAAMAAILRRDPGPLRSELDEQGLQVAALSMDRPPLVVTTDEVSICSPFPPQQPEPGRCGAHFVGLNARNLPWRYYDRPASEVRLEHWARWRQELYGRVGLDAPRRSSAGRALRSTHWSTVAVTSAPRGEV